MIEGERGNTGKPILWHQVSDAVGIGMGNEIVRGMWEGLGGRFGPVLRALFACVKAQGVKVSLT